MKRTMDRSRFQVASHEELDRQDKEYWANAAVSERLETVTYLRECFYGSAATTGRVQRVYRVLELK